MNDMTDTTSAPKSLSDLATELERARIAKAGAVNAYEAASRAVTEATLAEREAYRAFNEAVAAMKPKRKSPTPKAETQAKPVKTAKPKK